VLELREPLPLQVVAGGDDLPYLHTDLHADRAR
jgi:hypothetical protein